jgi:type IV fimbrial biogenesis protein FimT
MTIHGHGTSIAAQLGLTVLELITTLAIAGITLVIGIPSLQAFIQEQRIKSAVGTLHHSLNRARGTAIYRNQVVVACPGDPGGCREGSDWSDGWIVFTDLNGDRKLQPDEQPLDHTPGVNHVRILSSAGRRQIRFLPAGQAPGSNTTLSFCGIGGPAKARKLVVSNIGRIRRDRYPDIDPDLCPGAH